MALNEIEKKVHNVIALSVIFWNKTKKFVLNHQLVFVLLHTWNRKIFNLTNFVWNSKFMKSSTERKFLKFNCWNFSYRRNLSQTSTGPITTITILIQISFVNCEFKYFLMCDSNTNHSDSISNYFKCSSATCSLYYENVTKWNPLKYAIIKSNDQKLIFLNKFCFFFSGHPNFYNSFSFIHRT